MPWNSLSPNGALSVKDNRAQMNENTTYIETTMGNSIIGNNGATTRDHFWKVGANEDGRHRWVQSPAFTVGGNPADANIGTGMDGVLYIKTVNSDVGRVEGFWRNAQGIYQYIPSFKSATATIDSSSIYKNVVDVPKNVYGDIFMYTTAQGKYSTVTGFFRSGATKVEAWSLLNKTDGASTSKALEFLNGANATDLNIKAVLADGVSATYNYRITYRAL